MVKNDEVASVSFTDELINITPVEGYIYTDPDGQSTLAISLCTPPSSTVPTSSRCSTSTDVPYTKPYVAKMSPVLSVLLSMAPFLLILGLTFFMFRGVGGKGGMGGMMNVGKANAKVYMEKSTGVTFADVAGQDEAKESLVEIIDFLHNPGKYTAIGAKLPRRTAGRLTRHRQDPAGQSCGRRSKGSLLFHLRFGLCGNVCGRWRLPRARSLQGSSKSGSLHHLYR